MEQAAQTLWIVCAGKRTWGIGYWSHIQSGQHRCYGRIIGQFPGIF